MELKWLSMIFVAVAISAGIVGATETWSQAQVEIACATYPVPGSYSRLITDAPRSFNDHGAMIRLGHEFLHNLGGRHK